jgi:CBS domain-containing protein
MLVSEILRVKGHTLFTTTPDAPVLEAVRAMAQHDIGSLVVMDRGRLGGILTFREVLNALAARGGDLAGLANREILQRDPPTAAPSMDVMELRRMMLEHHARYVPVMEGDTLQGVISFHDVAKAIYDEASREKDALVSYING